jgi:hypothetical protein
MSSIHLSRVLSPRISVFTPSLFAVRVTGCAGAAFVGGGLDAVAVTGVVGAGVDDLEEVPFLGATVLAQYICLYRRMLTAHLCLLCLYPLG